MGKLRDLLKFGFLSIFLFFVISCGGGETGGDSENDSGPSVDLSRVFPAPDATDVEIDTEIKVVFKGDVYIYSVEQSTLKIKNSSNYSISGYFEYDSKKKEVTFSPKEDLSKNETYTVTCTTGIKDRTGKNLKSPYSWSFTTGSDAPKILYSSPSQGASEFKISEKIAIRFSKPLDVATINDTNIKLRRKGGGGDVVGSFTHEPLFKYFYVYFKPSVPLDFLTDYVLTVSTGVKDKDGTNMKSAYTVSFTTEEDTYPPKVSSITPSYGAKNVSLNSKIKVTFNKSMDASTITTSSFIIKDEGNDEIAGSVAYDSSTRTAVFTPTEPLIGTSKYCVELKKSITASNGAKLKEAYKTDFYTAKSTVEWVFMVYMAADNNLSDCATADLKEMRNSNLNGKKVRFIVLCDREGKKNTHLYEVIKGVEKRLSSEELKLSEDGNEELDTGDPENLKKFIEFVKKNYGANHYGLVLWNHGGGWRSRNKSISSRLRFKGKMSKKEHNESAVKDICWDDLSKSHLGNDAVQQALKGKGIDLLCMDACLMGMVETAYEMRKSETGIGHIVFSENIIPGNGYPYDTIINGFIAASDTSPANFGKIIVDKYFEEYKSSDGGFAKVATLSLFDLDKSEEVVTTLDSFVDYLKTLPNLNSVDLARKKAQAYDEPEYVDLYGFANEFSHSSATNLKNKIDEAVVYEKHNNDVSGSHGLSIYFPLITKDASYKGGSDNTRNIDFLDASKWVNYIQGNKFGYTIDTVEPQTDSNGKITSTVTVHKNDSSNGYILDAYHNKDNLGDEDFYTITVTQKGELKVNLTAVPSNCDLCIELYKINTDGWTRIVVADDEDDPGSLENLTHTVEVGKYGIIVAPADSASSSITETYTVKFSGTAAY